MIVYRPDTSTNWPSSMWDLALLAAEDAAEGIGLKIWKAGRDYRSGAT